MAKFTTHVLLLAAGLASLPNVFVSGANIRIVDFQDSCLDLPRSTGSIDAPQAAVIGMFPCSYNKGTYAWVATLTGLTNFNITSVAIPSIVLSVASVGPTGPATSQPLIDQPIIGRAGSAMTWKFVTNTNFPSKFNIVSVLSPGGVTVALRSYPKRTPPSGLADAAYSPLLLDTLNVKDPQQVFSIQNM